MVTENTVENLLVIPARLGSTRLPQKALISDSGMPLILHTVKRAVASQKADKVVVATDAKEIFEVVTEAGYEAMMTREDHESGTDRVAEVAEKFEAKRVVNVQGDEPFIEAELIDKVFLTLEARTDIPMVTAVKKEDSIKDLEADSVVKVIVDKTGRCLYFSRSMIPYDRDQQGGEYYRHLGIYGFQYEYLLTFRDLPLGNLEGIEKLEQLRAIENGDVIQAVVTEYEGFSVDTAEDYKEFLGRMK